MIPVRPPAEFRSLKGTVEQRRTARRPTSLRGPASRSTDKTGAAVGYAAVWYKPGDASTEYGLAPDVVERIARGAFTRSISEDSIVASFNHDLATILGSTHGRTLELSEDEIGLRYVAQLPNTQAARDVEELLARGDVAGSSFMFVTRRDEWTKDGDLYVRTLLEIDLIELGPVVLPAYAATTAGTGGLPESGRGSAVDQAAAARRLRTLVIVAHDIPDAIERGATLLRLERELARLRENGN